MWNSETIQIKGGLVRDIPEIQLGLQSPGAAASLTNFEPSIKGGYRRINGFTKFDSDVVPSTSSTSQLLGIGLLHDMVVVPREDKIYKSTGSGWTEIANSRTQPNKVRFTKINLNGTDKLIATDGENYPYSYDGTTLTELNSSADLLGATHALQYKDYVFYAVGSLVYFTSPYKEGDFKPANGAGNFNMKDRVTGIITFRDQLFIFCENNIQTITGTSPSNFVLSSVSESVGCVREDTIQEVSGDVFFVAKDGVRRLGATDRIGDFANYIVCHPVRNDVVGFLNTYGQISSTIVRNKSQYRIYGWNESYSSKLTEGFLGTQIGDTEVNWAKLKGTKIWACASEVYRGIEKILFVGETEYVYRLDDGDDFDGTAIKADFFSPYLVIDGDPMTRKTVYKITTYLSAEDSVTGNLSLIFDQRQANKLQPPSLDFQVSGSETTWGQFLWGSGRLYAGGTATTVSTITSGAGFNFSLQYSFEESEPPFTIDTIVVEYAIEGKN